ncbi:glycosyltransferase family 2 protein [Spirosoma endbachense]|uniref:Glycosyltransferase n=1 Tax=Spirosoma endbachense TaxID=2666025 RepID=A0A6P1VR37_9BACT|nr:glycosyltransferase family 2 protein [Spirosoma endbachense]QHV94069.1 glycosyltransferase [Spirosoma endbachense]
MDAILPKVTIVTPSYNQGQFIEATIQSVLNQTYPNIEYLLVDGGSTDETMDIVSRYRDRIDIVIHERDKGQSDAINKGFRAATGDLVGWINSDDVLLPDCVTQIVNLYKQHPDGGIYYGNTLRILDEQNRDLGVIKTDIPNRTHLLNQNYDVIQPGSFYPTKLVQQVGYVNETIHYCMDLDLWLRLLDYAPIYRYSEKPIAAYRRWGNTKTSTGGRRFYRDIQQVLQKHGANAYSRTLMKTRYYTLKDIAKQILLTKST